MALSWFKRLLVETKRLLKYREVVDSVKIRTLTSFPDDDPHGMEAQSSESKIDFSKKAASLTMNPQPGAKGQAKH